MPSWQIKFIVKGNRLDQALAIVHTLKPEELGVQPVNEKLPSADRTTARSQILAAMQEAGPKVKWNAQMMANRIGSTRSQISSHFSNMAAHKLVKRAGRGLFALRKEVSNG